jgi:Tol biopolymer transport system component
VVCAMVALVASCTSHETEPLRTATQSAPRVGAGSTPMPVDLQDRVLAFAMDDGVYLGRADGSDAHRITDIPGFEYQPDWTADGTKLVLRVDDPFGRSGGVWSVNADGSHPADLLKNSGVSGGTPDWSPDGTQIAFVGKRPGETFGIYVMNADGTGPIRLTSRGHEAQYPDWSPDGSRIAFTSVQGGQFDIYVMNANGSGVRQLTHAPGEDNWPEWSPDGRQIVYSHANELWMMNADGTGQHRLTVGAGEPSWSPDGDWIAFDCAANSDPIGGMCAMHPDGSERTPILGGVGSFPAWKP